MITGLSDARCLAGQPSDPSKAAGDPIVRSKGCFQPTEWLLLGPFPFEGDENRAIEQVKFGDETSVAPSAGEQAGSLVWKRSRAEGGIDFFKTYGIADHDRIAYLHTSVYVESDVEYGFRCEGNHGAWRLWVNGKVQDGWDQARHVLKAGWNQVLVKSIIRGHTTDSRVQPELYPFGGPDLHYHTTNIPWITPMPGPSFSMPLLVGDKLFVTSEPSDLLCIDKKSGKLLWMQSDTLWHAVASDVLPQTTSAQRERLNALHPMAEQLEEANKQYMHQPEFRLNQQRRKLAQDLTDAVKKIDPRYGVSLGWGGGNSTPTPCSDGRLVYVWHGETGVLSCYDLKGKCQWRRFQHTGDDAEHGFNSSPVIADQVIAVIGGARVIGFDRATGRMIWKQRYPHPCYASMVVARVGSENVLVTPVGMLLRASDGKVLQKALGQFDGECASAGLEENRFYLVARAGFCAAQLPASLKGDTSATLLGRLAPEALQDAETYPIGSPLCDGGLLYFTHSGWSGHQWPILFVLDPRRPSVIYSQKLDLDPEIHYAPDGAGIAESLTLAGRYIYVMANRGQTIVFKPGRTYEQVAKNTIESISVEGRQEITESTPIFDGSRMYYRGEQNLYCIGN